MGEANGTKEDPGFSIDLMSRNEGNKVTSTFNSMKKDQMLIKNFLLISLAALIGLTTYSTSFGAGSSDNDDSSSKEMVDVDYLNGKEEAYNGNYRAAIVYLKKSIENNPESADSFNLLGYSNSILKG